MFFVPGQSTSIIFLIASDYIARDHAAIAILKYDEEFDGLKEIKRIEL
jgi:hypothetical protein